MRAGIFGGLARDALLSQKRTGLMAYEPPTLECRAISVAVDSPYAFGT